MFSNLIKHKGFVITLTYILGGLFAIGITGLLYWLFLSRILEMHVAIDENANERNAINLANVFISSEKVAYEKDGKVMRGILDMGKINYVQIKDIGIAYPNSVSIITITDLEKCNSLNLCDTRIALLTGPISLQDLALTKFTECLSQHVNIDFGFTFREQFLGILGLWQPADLKNCAQNTLSSKYTTIISSSQISSQGFPVILRYPTGELHMGRIFVTIVRESV